jgi:hypothetical protein
MNKFVCATKPYQFRYFYVTTQTYNQNSNQLHDQKYLKSNTNTADQSILKTVASKTKQFLFPCKVTYMSKVLSSLGYYLMFCGRISGGVFIFLICLIFLGGMGSDMFPEEGK